MGRLYRSPHGLTYLNVERRRGFPRPSGLAEVGTKSDSAGELPVPRTAMERLTAGQLHRSRAAMGSNAPATVEQTEIDFVFAKLRWMREERIWPNGLRYLWTDAFGVVLLLSLYDELREERWLDEAEHLVADVDRVLGRPRGLRIGEAPDRDGQYYHYLAMWLFALGRLGEHRPGHRERAIRLARDIHSA